MLKREQIKGSTTKIFNYYFEIVTIKGLPRVFSLSKPLNKTLWRLEI